MESIIVLFWLLLLLGLITAISYNSVALFFVLLFISLPALLTGSVLECRRQIIGCSETVAGVKTD